MASRVITTHNNQGRLQKALLYLLFPFVYIIGSISLASTRAERIARKYVDVKGMHKCTCFAITKYCCCQNCCEKACCQEVCNDVCKESFAYPLTDVCKDVCKDVCPQKGESSFISTDEIITGKKNNLKWWRYYLFGKKD
ncbi:MAG: hypothetical protein FK732_00550 [Asgard group archaeon]|nr:hypothetical protein [Asgard group archaeon]